MIVRTAVKKLTGMLVIVALASLGFSSNALAHVTIQPSEVITSGYQTFVVNVPNEKDIPTVGIKLVIPEAITNVVPTQKAGWRIVKETAGSGESKRTLSIMWQDGKIVEGARDEFTFSARIPDNATKLEWKAYQTYADGTVVAWDRADGDTGHDGNVGPLSVTNVVAQTSDTIAKEDSERLAIEAKETANRSLYVAIAGVLLGIVGIFLGTRKNNK